MEMELSMNSSRNNVESTLFFGNGLNLLTDNQPDWGNLLTELSRISRVEISNIKVKPYTMIYEEILLRSGFEESELKECVKNIVSDFQGNEIYEEISNLKFTNYITTNYDLTLEKVFNNSLFFKYLSDQSEAFYSIRSKFKILNKFGQHVSNVWHIHGDIKRKKTISLGLDHYCGSIGKIDSYIKGTYTFKKNKTEQKPKSIALKIKNKEERDNLSWIELFFYSDIHIIGYGIDYSETDIWWILNRRARIKNIQNKIYYYGELDFHKVELLNAFNVEYIEIKRDETLQKKGWLDLYEKIIIEIKQRRL